MKLSGREKRFLVVVALAILFFSVTESVLTSYRIGLAKGLETELQKEEIATSTNLNLSVEKSQDERRLVVKSEDLKPEVKDTDEAGIEEAKKSNHLESTSSSTTQNADSKVAKTANGKPLLNINTADYDQLVELPGIGPVLAERILTYRLEKGRFLSLDELMEVRGIGEKLLLKIKPYLTI
ncbi:MAG: helix-hairpin-helix domain-containing protein [Firmicutes bacterium]|nr:helix-hairpin-helix domain-containing protein [Bacillota bacterium]MDD4263999.1 helix-hairpin-helix domain-containing protein [Bacillota bacterium]MDD4692919.1 helix-hairpin-helix domain-containing protein [Bacillota bacterium]